MARLRSSCRSAVWAALAVALTMCIASEASAAGRWRIRALVRPHIQEQIAAIAADCQAEVVSRVGDGGYFVLRTAVERDTDKFLRTLASDGRVACAEPNALVTIPEIRGYQLAFAFDASMDPLGYTNQFAFRQVRLGDAHSFATGRRVKVAILDTGVNVDHPDLVGHCVRGYNALDPSMPPDDLPAPSDAEISVMGIRDAGVGHGTMVAGIVAIVAPDARIAPVKVLAADGSGTVADVVEGIYWAIRHGADVINMSFGAPASSDAVEDAVKDARRAGIVVVASAGNDNTDIPHCPAALKGVISVSSVECDNIKSPYASFGTTVDLVAPGSGIRSTFWDGGYATWNGTSFAAPFVTGAAALLRELESDCGPARIGTLLGKTATSVEDANPDYLGWLGDGLLNIRKAVRRAD